VAVLLNEGAYRRLAVYANSRNSAVQQKTDSSAFGNFVLLKAKFDIMEIDIIVAGIV